MRTGPRDEGGTGTLIASCGVPPHETRGASVRGLAHAKVVRVTKYSDVQYYLYTGAHARPTSRPVPRGEAVHKSHATRVMLLRVESSGNSVSRYVLPSVWILDWSGPLPLGALSP